MTLEPLPRGFYDRDVIDVARGLLGCLLVRGSGAGRCGGRIVEVEAYLPADDPANHAYRGRTDRNASMFGPPGHAYVYSIHSRWCLNAVAGPAGVPAAVLIRAIEPWLGVEIMRANRPNGPERDLARGPARLCEALAIDRSLDGWDLTLGQRLWIAPAPEPVDPVCIATTPRVGVTSARELPLRFLIAGSPHVSKPRHGRDGGANRRPRQEL